MAKEFKDFDKKYTKFAGTAIKNLNESVKITDNKALLNFQRGYIADIQVWAHVDFFTEDYSQSTIRFAVYEALGAEEWQKFRVSLKGLTTREKLYALEWYWNTHVAPGVSAYGSVNEWSHQVIRINNYLGALKRGGQLDSQLRVIKG